MKSNRSNPLLFPGIALVAGFVLAATLNRRCAPSNDAPLATATATAKEPSDDLREARKIRHAVEQALTPKVVWSTQAPVATLRQQMIIDHPSAGFATWAIIAAAESELISPEHAMLLGRDGRLGLDCFPAQRAWPEFTYSLTIQASPTLVTVGGFEITDNSLPQTIQTCLEELFQGEVSLAGEALIPFKTVVQRQSHFVELITIGLSKFGRDEILRRIETFRGAGEE